MKFTLDNGFCVFHFYKTNKTRLVEGNFDIDILSFDVPSMYGARVFYILCMFDFQINKNKKR